MVYAYVKALYHARLVRIAIHAAPHARCVVLDVATPLTHLAIARRQTESRVGQFADTGGRGQSQSPQPGDLAGRVRRVTVTIAITTAVAVPYSC